MKLLFVLVMNRIITFDTSGTCHIPKNPDGNLWQIHMDYMYLEKRQTSSCDNSGTESTWSPRWNRLAWL